ncbi:MAG: phosphatase PAP2 family protein [Chloroflexota bacterium]|nr:phosphatase PAP2 family protein [Chloroflexota bacterium]
MDAQRYAALLTPGRRRVFLLLDQYADGATGALALASLAAQWAVGTPGSTLLTALALVFPAGLITYGLNRLCKALLPKPRQNRHYHALISPWLRGSFPSFHTQFATTFAATFVTAVTLLVPPEARPLAGGLAGVTMGGSVALVAWSRLYLAVHDRVDVLGGVVLGALVGSGVAAGLIRAGWVPTGAPAWAGLAGLVGTVLAVSLWERRKRRAAGA